MAAEASALEAVLEESRARGFLGPGSVAAHIAHARGFLAAVEQPPRTLLDLGSGGGVPGLVLAAEWPETQVVLLEAMERRAAHLRAAAAELFGNRVEVLCERAEVAGRDPSRRERYDVVTARSFGSPAVTAECGAPFLVEGGLLVVSEPPTDEPARWPADGLASLGLEVARPASPSWRFVVLCRRGPLSERYPRRVGVPAKRPLW